MCALLSVAQTNGMKPCSAGRGETCSGDSAYGSQARMSRSYEVKGERLLVAAYAFRAYHLMMVLDRRGSSHG